MTARAPSSKPKLKPKRIHPTNPDFDAGACGRIVGAAHRHLSPHLVAWVALLGGAKAVAYQIRRTKVGRAKATKGGRGSRNLHPTMVSKIAHGTAMFPVDAMGAWAKGLSLNDREYDALMNVAVFANASRRLLCHFDWKAVADTLGAKLVQASQYRVKLAASGGRAR